jgi:hypothetical protein
MTYHNHNLSSFHGFRRSWSLGDTVFRLLFDHFVAVHICDGLSGRGSLRVLDLEVQCCFVGALNCSYV